MNWSTKKLYRKFKPIVVMRSVTQQDTCAVRINNNYTTLSELVIRPRTTHKVRLARWCNFAEFDKHLQYSYPSVLCTVSRIVQLCLYPKALWQVRCRAAILFPPFCILSLIVQRCCHKVFTILMGITVLLMYFWKRARTKTKINIPGKRPVLVISVIAFQAQTTIIISQ